MFKNLRGEFVLEPKRETLRQTLQNFQGKLRRVKEVREMRPNEFGDPRRSTEDENYRRGGGSDGTRLWPGAGADGTRCRGGGSGERRRCPEDEN